MSRMQRISLMNDFIFNLDDDMRYRVEEFVGDDYGMDDRIILSEFGLEEKFQKFVSAHAA